MTQKMKNISCRKRNNSTLILSNSYFTIVKSRLSDKNKKDSVEITLLLFLEKHYLPPALLPGKSSVL